MAQGLVLLAYNVYYNRFLKFEASLADYITNSEGSDYLIQNVNFNPSDGLNTSHIIGKGELDHGLSFTDYSYTYALVIEYNSALKTRDEIYADKDTRIISKWFILDNDRTRGGQYKIDLRRDVLVDYMKQIRKSPIFVEKGIINDLNSPLLLNNEDVRVNQIKKKEYLLKDSTNIAWLVLYLKKGALGNNSIGPNNDGIITIDTSQDDDFVDITLTTPITSWAYYQYVNTDFKVCNYVLFTFNYRYIFPNYDAAYYNLNYSDNDDSYFVGNNFNWVGNLTTTDNDVDPKLAAQCVNDKSTLKSYVLSELSYNSSGSSLQAFNGKIIKDSTGKYFKVRVYTSSQGDETHAVTTAECPSLKSTMAAVWNTALNRTDIPNDAAFKVKVNYTSLRITLEELPNFTTQIDFGAYTGKGTDSALYDVLFLPYGPCWIIKGGSSLPDQANKDRSMAIMSSITTQLTSAWVLDLQVIPYFPALELSYGANNIHFPDNPENIALVAKNAGTVTDIIGVCKTINYTLDLWVKGNGNPLIIEDDSDVPDVYKRKYVNDCTMVRLCSPNYNGVFEFNLAKNGGQIRRINVDITLRPYNPYIHANPDFDFLYGSDYNDQRGLLCGGDFSLGIINDSWYSYEIQNKNYQAIFDRQIQNLDLNNAIARQEAGWGMAAGVVSGAASGAAGGAIAGGGWGALAGAVIGAGTSAVGGALDWQNLEKRQREARNFAIDNYNLQLGTVRALPNSITKTSALTFNNKIFLFYEVYECSEEEKQAYYLKLKYNGMTVGKIDYINSYMSDDNSNYFRGKLIILHGEEGSNAVENRIIEAINMELMKGVFI